MNESWPVNIRAHYQRRHDRLAPSEQPPHLINEYTSRGLYPILFQCGQRRRGLLSIEPALGV